MSNVGYATLTILPSAQGFASALGREVNPALAAAGAASGTRSARQFGGSFLPVMKGMLGTAAGLGVGLAVGNGIKTGLKTAAFMEQAMVSFETLLGDSGKAKAMLADVSAFAAKTPFELPGLTDNVRALLGAGAAAKSVLPTMTALGNTNAALGGSQENLNSVVRAWTQMMGKGKVSAEEMLQITEAGIPIWTIASKAMGKPVGELQKMASEGKLLSSDVLPLLEAQMNKDYGGSMEKQAKTLSGVWSTVQDTINMALANAVQPLVPILTAVLPGAADAAAKGIGWISDAISGLAKLLIGGDFTGALTNAFGWQEDSGAVDKILTIREAVVGFFDQLRSGKGEAGSAFKAVTDALTPLWTIISTQVLPALVNLGNAITTGVQPVLGVIGDIIRTSIVPAFQEMAAKAGPLFTQLGETINVVATQIGPILQGIADVIRNVWGFIGPFVMDTLMGMFNNVVGIFSGVFTVIQGVVNLVSALFRGDWAAAWDALGQIVSGAVQAVWNFVQLWIVGKLTAMVGGAMGALRGLFGGAWDFIAGIVRGAANSVSSTVGWLLAGMQGVVSGGMAFVRGLFVAAWDGMVGAVRGAWGMISGAVSGGVSGVMGFISSLPGRILGALSGLGNLLWNAGKAILDGLLNGLKAAWSGVTNFVGGIAGWIADHKGPISYDRTLLIPAGIAIMEGLGKGLKSQLGSLTNTLGTITRTVVDEVVSGLADGSSAVAKAAGSLIPKVPDFSSPNVAVGGIQGALASTAGGTAQAPIHQENHFNVPMSEEAYAELAARKLLRAGVGR